MADLGAVSSCPGDSVRSDSDPGVGSVTRAVRAGSNWSRPRLMACACGPSSWCVRGMHDWSFQEKKVPGPRDPDHPDLVSSRHPPARRLSPIPRTPLRCARQDRDRDASPVACGVAGAIHSAARPSLVPGTGTVACEAVGGVGHVTQRRLRRRARSQRRPRLPHRKRTCGGRGATVRPLYSFPSPVGMEWELVPSAAATASCFGWPAARRR